MGKPKQEKPKEDRLAEGVSLLKQMKDQGVDPTSEPFQQLQQQISTWVRDGLPWEGQIAFPMMGRVAKIQLPRYTNKAADIHFVVKR